MEPRHEEIAVSIEEFIRARFDVKSTDAVFGRTVSLWEQGYVDSIGVVEVIDFLESTFAVTIPEETLFSPGFTHIDGMAHWVLELRERPNGAHGHHV
jgi:acyl carrier protein